MKCQVLEVLLPFIFLQRFDRRKYHKMLALMLNFRFENMCLIISYVNCENATSFFVYYGSQLLLPSLMEAYKSLMLNVIDEPQLVEGLKINFKDLFHTT